MSVACGGESPLDGICLSESDKTAVLTLIREEVNAFLFQPLIAPFFVKPCAAGRFHLCWPPLSPLEVRVSYSLFSSDKGLPVKRHIGAGVLTLWCPLYLLALKF